MVERKDGEEGRKKYMEASYLIKKKDNIGGV
jgi:hypothetical protein